MNNVCIYEAIENQELNYFKVSITSGTLSLVSRYYRNNDFVSTIPILDVSQLSQKETLFDSDMGRRTDENFWFGIRV